MLSEISCKKCDFSFKVEDVNNFVCTNCYYKEIPKYVSSKYLNDELSPFGIKNDETIAQLICDAEMGAKPTGAEKRYTNELLREFDSRGILCTPQFICDNGIVDIYVDGAPPQIIEVKGGNSGMHLKQALGQLLFYSQSFPGSKLFIATRRKLHPEHKRILALYGVHEWVF